MDNANLIITKPKLSASNGIKFSEKIDSSKFILSIVVFIVFILILCITYSFKNNKKDSFSNDNISEQQMFNEMTEENKQIYLELPDDAKLNMFNTWKRIKNL